MICSTVVIVMVYISMQQLLRWYMKDRAYGALSVHSDAPYATVGHQHSEY